MISENQSKMLAAKWLRQNIKIKSFYSKIEELRENIQNSARDNTDFKAKIKQLNQNI